MTSIIDFFCILSWVVKSFRKKSSKLSARELSIYISTGKEKNQFSVFNVITPTARFVFYSFHSNVFYYSLETNHSPLWKTFVRINNNTAKLQLTLRRSFFSIKWLKFHHEQSHWKKITFDGKCTSSAGFSVQLIRIHYCYDSTLLIMFTLHRVALIKSDDLRASWERCELFYSPVVLLP